MIDSSSQRVFFGVLLFVVTAAFIWLIRGFIQPIFWAVALTIIFYPFHTRIRKLLKGRDSVAATASVLLIVLVVILPLAGIIAAVTTEAVALVDRLQSGGDLERAIQWIREQVPRVNGLMQSVNVDAERIQSQLSSWAVQASSFIASQALAIGQNTLRITMLFFLMLYLLFFFLRDGLKMIDSVIRVLPLGDERERHLLDRFAEVSRATLKGTLVVGVVQGAIGGLAFAFLGIGAAVLWGVVMALLSIIPAVGPGLVWMPAAIILIANGQIISGIVLIVVGFLIVGLADNVLRPILVGRDTRMPDYLILLSTIGGLVAFGLAGIVIGPIIAAFFLSVWEMAEDEYGETRSNRFTRRAASTGRDGKEPLR